MKQVQQQPLEVDELIDIGDIRLISKTLPIDQLANLAVGLLEHKTVKEYLNGYAKTKHLKAYTG